MFTGASLGRQLTTTLALLLFLAGCGLAPQGGEAAPSAEAMAEIEAAVVKTVIADADNLYATYPLCEGSTCRVRLAATHDGGKTWSHHDFPVDTFPARKPRSNNLTFTLTGIGPQTLRMFMWTGGNAPQTSTDGGATWKKAPANAHITSVVPVGWRLLDFGIDQGPGKSTMQVGDPATGQIGNLEVPRRSSLDVSLPGSPEHGIWLQSRELDQVNLNISHDRGSTWISRQLELPITSSVIELAGAADGRTVFLQASGSKGQVWLYRTDDGGVTWEKTVPTGLAENLYVEDTAVLPDGSVLVACGLFKMEREFYLSKDGGRTFKPFAVAGFGKRYDLTALPGGGFASGRSTSNVRVGLPFNLSADGRVWRQIDVPRT